MATTEETLGEILAKLNEKKSRDAWDKAQIFATIAISIGTLLLAIINLKITSNISGQTVTLQKLQHSADSANKVIEQSMKNREEFVQELAALPTILKLLGKEDKTGESIARQILADMQKKKADMLEMPLNALARQAAIELTVSPKNAVSQTAGASGNPTYWAYLGQHDGGKWQTKLFDIPEMPALGQVIASRSYVYLHDSKPIKIAEPDTWNFGKTVKTITPKSTVRVLDTLRLEGNNLWAKVQ